MTCPLSPADRERFAMERDLVGHLPRCYKNFKNWAVDNIPICEGLCTLPKGHSGGCAVCFRSVLDGSACFARTAQSLPSDLLERYHELSCCT